MQGAIYPNIEAVKDAVRLWSISLKREFRVVKSGSKEYEVKCECWMSMASTCIQGKMEVKLEMFHCHRAHLFAVRSSFLASQYIMRLCCKANIWVDYGQPKL